MTFSLTPWLTSMPANPTTTPLSTSTTHRSIWRQPTSCMVLLRCPLACNPALARPSKAATGRILQMRTIDALCEKPGERQKVWYSSIRQGSATISEVARGQCGFQWGGPRSKPVHFRGYKRRALWLKRRLGKMIGGLINLLNSCLGDSIHKGIGSRKHCVGVGQ